MTIVRILAIIAIIFGLLGLIGSIQDNDIAVTIVTSFCITIDVLMLIADG